MKDDLAQVALENESSIELHHGNSEFPYLPSRLADLPPGIADTGSVHLVSHCPEVIEGAPTILRSCVSHATARLSQISKLSLHTVHASSSARVDLYKRTSISIPLAKFFNVLCKKDTLLVNLRLRLLSNVL